MSARLDTQADGRWIVSGELNFDSVCGLLPQSRTAFESVSELCVDLAQVGRSNSAGLALLIEWMRWSTAAGIRIRFEQIPDSLRRLASISGLELPESLAN